MTTKASEAKPNATPLDSLPDMERLLDQTMLDWLREGKDLSAAKIAEIRKRVAELKAEKAKQPQANPFASATKHLPFPGKAKAATKSAPEASTWDPMKARANSDAE